MGEVNEYFKEKYEDSQAEFRKKIKQHRLSILYRVLLVVAIIITVVVAAYYNYQNMIYSDYDVLKTIGYTEASNARYINLNGKLLRYSNDGASAYSMDNEMLWNETFEMQTPMIDVCNDYVAIGDYKGSSVYVFNSEGLQGTIETTTPIRSFCVSGTGNVAAVMEEGDVTWVKLYDKTGTNFASDRTTMAKSGYPLDVDISSNGILMAVSYLYVDSGVISSSVAYYNFGAVGQNEVDNLVSGYNYSDTVVSYVEFMNEDTSFAVGDNRLEIFKGDQKPENVFELLIQDEIESVFNNDNYIALVFAGSEGELAHKLMIYDTSGECVLTQQFDLDYSDIVISKDLVIIYNSTDCEIYNMKGLQKYSGTFKNSAITLIPTGSKTKFLLVSGDGMEEIQLK